MEIISPLLESDIMPGPNMHHMFKTLEVLLCIMNSLYYEQHGTGVVL